MVVKEAAVGGPRLEESPDTGTQLDEEPAKPETHGTFKLGRKGAKGLSRHPQEALFGLRYLEVDLGESWDSDIQHDRVLIELGRLIQAIKKAKTSKNRSQSRIDELTRTENYWFEFTRRNSLVRRLGSINIEASLDEDSVLSDTTKLSFDARHGTVQLPAETANSYPR